MTIMTNKINTNIDMQVTTAIIAKVCGLHKFTNATQKHIILGHLGSIMPYNN